MADIPLTLQQCCYLCLLTSPDLYTVGYLPTKLRHLLLVNMPATNLCYLEGTPATEDVDMDTVWKEVSSKRIITFHNLPHSSAFTGITPKDEFFIEIISEILEGSLLKAAAYLVGVYESECPFGIGDFYALPQSVLKYVHCTHHYPSGGACLIPPSHAPSLQAILKKPYKYEKHEWETLVNAVMSECHYFPKYVNIPLRYSPYKAPQRVYMYDDPWYCTEARYNRKYNRKERSKLTDPIRRALPEIDAWVPNPEAAADSLGMFASATEEVTFLPRRANSTEKSHFTLGSILANSKPKLKTVIMDRSCPSSGFVDEIINEISPYLSDASYGPMSESISKPAVPNPHTSLKSLIVAVGEHEIGPHSNLPRELSTIINHQSSLEKLHLEHLPPLTAEEYHPLYCSIATFVKEPQFREVTLTNIKLPAMYMQEILHQFLASPSSQKQKLCLHKVAISNNKPALFPEGGASHLPLTLRAPSAEGSCLPAPLSSQEDTVLYKSLHFSDIKFPTDLGTWLFHHSQLKLHTLHLADVQVLDNHVLDLFQEKHKLPIENLVLCGKVFPDSPPFDYFDCLLTNPNLRNLQLRSCTGHSDVFLSCFIHGLLNQSKVGSLKHLALVDVELGRQSDSDLKLLFETIFSLPQLETFALDLSNNKLTGQKISMLYSTWREQCSKHERRLQYLRISDVDHYDIICYSLEKLAVQTDFEADN